MSTETPDLHSQSKFTKGEKCVFAHLVITVVLIIIIVLVCYVHYCVVKHSGDELYRITRRQHARSARNGSRRAASWSRCAVAVYVDEAGAGGAASRARVACGAALVSAHWSLAPGHCVVARAHPDLAHLLPYWTIRYQVDDSHDGSGGGAVAVRRGAVHPRCDADDLTANVGLFEHAELASTAATVICSIPTEVITDELLYSDNEEDLSIVGWQAQDRQSTVAVHALTAEQCLQFAAPVVERLRAGEVCVISRTPRERPELGSVLFIKERLAGITSWGDTRGKGFPLVVMDISPFSNWLHTMLSN